MHRMWQRRSRSKALLISVVCLLLSACGGGQAHSSSAWGTSIGASHAVPVALGSPTVATSPPPSRAQALAYAHAVNLNASDIPGASVDAKRAHGATANERREYRACERFIAPSHKLAESSSPKLKRGQELEMEQITSSVEVLSSERAVARQFVLLAMPSLRKCAARALTRNLDDKPLREAHWGHVKVSQLPVKAPGTSATIGIRILATLNLPFSEVSVPIYVDVLGFALGRAEVALTATSATQPVPGATEQELLALLLARARAHRL